VASFVLLFLVIFTMTASTWALGLGTAWILDRAGAVAVRALDPYLCLSDFCKDVQEARQFQRWCRENTNLCRQIANQGLKD
jgi:hypothetical protein